MGTEVHIEPATPAHAHSLAQTMRAADVAEIRACGFATPLAALLAGIERSAHVFTVRFDGKPAVMFGATALPAPTLLGGPTVGAGWFLTGAAVDRHPREFLRSSRVVVGALLDYCPVLTNMVDDRYVAAKRFLFWLGAELGEPEPFGPAGLLFRRAVLRRSSWAQ